MTAPAEYPPGYPVDLVRAWRALIGGDAVTAAEALDRAEAAASAGNPALMEAFRRRRQFKRAPYSTGVGKLLAANCSRPVDGRAIARVNKRRGSIIWALIEWPE